MLVWPICYAVDVILLTGSRLRQILAETQHPA
jgi:hypothetical protein